MKLGFIGCGNMAGAMMGGIIKNNIFKAEDVYGSDVFEPSRERVKNSISDTHDTALHSLYCVSG